MNIIFIFTNNIIGDAMENNQTIKCDVYSCKHCNCDECICMLNEIKVSNKSNDMKKEATMCANYKKEK